MTNKSKGKNDGLRHSQYWDERAEEARARAEEGVDVEARALMLSIADMYDRLAAHALKSEVLGDKPAHNSN
jgi:hypothetical protein